MSKGDTAVTQNKQPRPGQNQPAVELWSVLQQENDVTASLVQMQTSQLQPYREIPTDDGDLLQFNSCMKAFEHCVEAKIYYEGDSLYYLEKYTKGRPRDIVSSYLHMTSEKGYTVAKQLLEEHLRKI